MKKDELIYIKNFIQTLLTKVQNDLQKDSIDSVTHYLEHDEFEMAFEGLFLELMSINDIPDIDFQKSKEVGEILKLNVESVFDFEFWNKFEKYIETCNTKRY